MAKRLLSSALAILAAVGGLSAQEREKTTVPLRVGLAIAPAPDGSDPGAALSFYVLAGSRTPTLLRSGQEVSVPAADGQYRNVGTNVTCQATPDGEAFRIELDIERSSLAEESDPARPSFRTLSYHAAFRIRDGGKVELAGGPDQRRVTADLQVLEK
jgi:hypothetical protein